MDREPDPLTIRRGLIVAPAGCGKTHTIISALCRHSGTKPILVLTHTNAGVAALRRRLADFHVPRSAYRLATIDGWAMRLIATFPARSGWPGGTAPRRPDYRQIREMATRLIRGGHIARLLVASYDRLIVDEYQDCSGRQHRLVTTAAKTLPTVVLGDPLQAIFSFDRRDPLPNWSGEVCGFFPLAGELSEPWRWRNAGNQELGDWLARVRASLLDGQAVDLHSAPNSVHWVQLRGGKSDYISQLNAAKCRHRKPHETALLIGDSKSEDSRHRIAKSVPGVVAIEPVDLRPLTSFATRLERAQGDELPVTLRFASQLMTNVNYQKVLRRMPVLRGDRARKRPDQVESAALALCTSPDLATIADLLEACRRRTDTRLYRPELFTACIQAIRLSVFRPECVLCGCCDPYPRNNAEPWVDGYQPAVSAALYC